MNQTHVLDNTYLYLGIGRIRVAQSRAVDWIVVVYKAGLKSEAVDRSDSEK